jgi:hypothetical protein
MVLGIHMFDTQHPRVTCLFQLHVVTCHSVPCASTVMRLETQQWVRDTSTSLWRFQSLRQQENAHVRNNEKEQKESPQLRPNLVKGTGRSSWHGHSFSTVLYMLRPWYHIPEASPWPLVSCHHSKWNWKSSPVVICEHLSGRILLSRMTVVGVKFLVSIFGHREALRYPLIFAWYVCSI